MARLGSIDHSGVQLRDALRPLRRRAKVRGAQSQDRRPEVLPVRRGAQGRHQALAMQGLWNGVYPGDPPGLPDGVVRGRLRRGSRHGDRLAFTTDSYVVDPLFFPGGDIGELAINGTINDLAMCGAQPLFLSCAVILEEGFPVSDLRRIAQSMQHAAQRAGVSVVTGDTKVVHRGAADKLFINTAGIGVVPLGVHIAAARAQPGDRILVNGFIGDHGVAILAARDDLELEVPIASDTQPLNGLVKALLAACPDVHCLRDATRGGIASVVNEIAEAAGVCIRLHEPSIPVREAVRGVSEILGLDPLYYANEGKLVAVLPSAHADAALAAMRAHPCGRDAALIGEVTAQPPGSVDPAD
jgi:hydrogenase expression/formation protein HypE